jgi:hypothetical protein
MRTKLLIFKRVRQFPTNQRFEPLVPGMTFFLSDAWAAGDPMLTWGEYKIVKRMPMLAGVSGYYNWPGGKHPTEDQSVHGGPKGKTFYDTWMELVPEVAVFSSVPTGYPRAPVGRRDVYVDVRNGMFPSQITYDRRGDIWKQFEPWFGQYKNDKAEVLAPDGKPDWSWLGVHSHDIQSNRMTRFRNQKNNSAGYKRQFTDEGVDVYNKFLTTAAIARLGQ